MQTKWSFIRAIALTLIEHLISFWNWTFLIWLKWPLVRTIWKKSSHQIYTLSDMQKKKKDAKDWNTLAPCELTLHEMYPQILIQNCFCIKKKSNCILDTIKGFDNLWSKPIAVFQLSEAKPFLNATSFSEHTPCVRACRLNQSSTAARAMFYLTALFWAVVCNSKQASTNWSLA